MHQSIHNNTEAELQQALSNAAWWEETCEYWREQCQAAQRQRDLASRSVLEEHFKLAVKLCEEKNCIFSLTADDNEGTEDMGFEWRVRGPRGLNNAAGPFDNIPEAVNSMLDWLETAQENPSKW